MKKGQIYHVENSLVSGVIDMVSTDKVRLKRLTDRFGGKIKPVSVMFSRESIEASIISGHIILGDGKRDPNTAFKLRKRNVI